MALAAAIGEAFLTSAVDLLLRKLASPEILRFFKSQKLDDRQLEDMKAKMRSVSKLLTDAEDKQITNSYVKDWLDELRDAVYEAEDFFDELAFEAAKLESEAETQSQTCTDQMRGFLSSLIPCKKGMKEMVSKLEEICHTLERLLKQKDDLGLEVIQGKSSFGYGPKTSLPEDSDFFGRDDDLEAIVKLMLSAHANGKNIQVIPIVGMGGIGKTTLAQRVYHDGRVQECFALKAWVYVSKDFDHLKVTKDLAKEFGVGDCNAMTENQLHEELEKKMKEKKALIVLDDVWNDDASDGWGFLLAPLKVLGEGSKIIVTTRHESVASFIQKTSIILTVSTYHVEVLTDDCCWLLFSKRAFPNNNASSHPRLEQIGRELVRKCGGLPLAARTLGALLCSNTNATEWEEILNSNIWVLPNVDVLPALRLSYYGLPSHLKQCFAYCAVFPKGYEFEKEQLTLLWLAEGFMVQPEGGEKFQVLGDRCFDDLVSRSFFQRSSAESSCFVMHDLINDLARDVSREFCLNYEYGLQDNNLCKLPKKTRYLSYPMSRSHGSSNLLDGIHEVHPLRTLFTPTTLWSAHFNNQVLNDILIILKRLRVLSLSEHYSLCQLPKSIGNLRHLRYLDLSYTSLERLLETVSTLHNLQTLILQGCRNLEELPTNMSKLVNLQHLDIHGTKLKEMPSQMGKLTKLRKLTDFFLGNQSGSSIKELGKLVHLQGELCIWNLQNVVDVQDALEANLKGKKQLQKLGLRWNGDTQYPEHEFEVLEKLQAHINVKILAIDGYGGKNVPSNSNLVELVLCGCKQRTSLPPLGQLPSLEKLEIKAFDRVVSVGSEFYGSDPLMEKQFKSLKFLRFEEMSQWEEWNNSDAAAAGAFPLLEELYIGGCPKLRNALPSQLPSLRMLEIEGCPWLLVSIAVAPNLTTIYVCDYHRHIRTMVSSTGMLSLTVSKDSLLKAMEQMSGLSTSLADIAIDECDSLECFQLELFPKLERLDIGNCLNLESVCICDGSLGDFTSLRYLSIRDCPTFFIFPGGLAAPNLASLELRGCINLMSLPERMHLLLPSLEKLELISLPELDSFPRGGLPSKLKSLCINDCRKLIDSRMLWDLESLPSLSNFTIDDYEDMESFPEETLLLPSTLTSLSISSLWNLKSLNYEGLQRLTSLRELEIRYCHSLCSLPLEGLPSSLCSLGIWSCPFLEERCGKEGGEDWHKISHIPEIKINGCKVN